MQPIGLPLRKKHPIQILVNTKVPIKRNKIKINKTNKTIRVIPMAIPPSIIII